MESALQEISLGSMTIRCAAEDYSILRSTLGEHASGHVVLIGTKSGALIYLSPEEEEELVQFLIQSADIGYPNLCKKYGLWLVQFF